MAMKILALDGLNDAKMCKLMGVLLQTIPGVEYANIDYLAQKLTLQISARDTSRVVARVVEMLKENMPGVTMRYVDVATGQASSKPESPAASKRSGNMNIDLTRAAMTIKSMVDSPENDLPIIPKAGAEEKKEPPLAANSAKNVDLPFATDGGVKEEPLEPLKNLEDIKGIIPEERLTDEVGGTTAPEEIKRPKSLERNSAIRAMVMKSKGLINEESTEEFLEGEATEGEAAEGGATVDGATEDGRVPVQNETEDRATEDGATVGGATEDGRVPVQNETEDGATVDGRVPVQNETEGEATEGEAAEGEATEGEATEGEATEGEATEGEATEGEATEGEATEGEATEGEATEGEATEEVIDVKQPLFKNIDQSVLQHLIAVGASLLLLLLSFLFAKDSAGQIIFQFVPFAVLMIFGIVADPGEDNELISIPNSIIVSVAAALMFFTGQRISGVVTVLCYNAVFFIVCGMKKSYDKRKKKIIDIVPDKITIERESGRREVIDFNSGFEPEPVVIAPGEVIPFDGYVCAGSSKLDCSFITGNSDPVDVTIGQSVNCGDINLNNEIKIVMTALPKNCLMYRIRQIVLAPFEGKSSSVKAAKRATILSGILGVAILCVLTAAYIYSGNEDKVLYIVPLIVALLAPCGVTACTKLLQSSILCKAAKEKMVINGIEALSALSNAKLLACNSTGILTVGKCVITSVQPISDVDEEDLIQTAAYAQYMNKGSMVGEAIVDYYRTKYGKRVVASHIANCTVEPNGVTALAESRVILVGNNSYMARKRIHTGDTGDLTNCLYVARFGQYIGKIFYEEPMNNGAKNFVSSLKNMGFEKVCMVTDEPLSRAKDINRSLRCDEIYAEYDSRNKHAAVGAIISRSSDPERVVYVGKSEECRSISKLCPTVAMGEDAIPEGINYAAAMVPKGGVDTLHRLFSIVKSGNTRYHLSIWLLFIFKLTLLVLGLLFELPLGIIGVAVCAALILEALNASHI